MSANYTFENAPQPKVIVVPAQRGSEAMSKWLRDTYKKADVTMSVCTGAFQLAKAGLLSGLSATTHHASCDRLEKEFPAIKVIRGVRFVEKEKVSTSAGLTAGMDLALRIAERYFGRAAAQKTADYMEYQGTGWIVCSGFSLLH